MNKIELAYLAGVLDSDGFMSIKRHAPNQHRPNSYTFSEFMGVGQSSPEAVELFAKYWGGKVKIRKRKAPKGSNGWKPIYYWTISCKMTSNCVKDLRPYLKIKTRQADLILQLRESKKLPTEQRRTRKVGIKNRALNQEVVDYRLKLYEEIRALNDRRSTQSSLFYTH